MIFKLKHPITFGKITLDKLTLREHTTAEDYLAFDQRGGVAQRIALIASISGQDEHIIKQLHGLDYQRAVVEVDRLLSADDLDANINDGGTDTALAELKEKAAAGDAHAIKQLAELETKKK
jgi:hypothetical protein